MSGGHPRVDEAFEPYEPRRRVPLPVYWIAIALALWGALTLWRDNRGDAIGRRNRAASHAATVHRAEAPGAALFAARCSTCHQDDGGGIVSAVPPLAGSPVVAADPSVIVRIMLHGITGPIVVAGQRYDGHMPAFASVLDDAQVARIASYVRSAWGNGAGPVRSDLVARARAADASRSGPWRGGAEIARALMPALAPQPAFATGTIATADPGIAAIIFRGKDGGWACASCHGKTGEGSDTTPRLAGLPASYIVDRLRGFATGGDGSDSMAAVASGLSARDMAGLGRWFAGLATPSTSRPQLAGDLARGARLALEGDGDTPACFSCHGSSGFGVPPATPPIAAQQAPYLARRLARLADAHPRSTPARVMAAVASRLSEADRRAVADYLATLPPVPAGTAPKEK